MKKWLLTAAATGAIAMAFTGSVHADEGWYVSAGVGNGGFGSTETSGYRLGAEIDGAGDWRQNAAMGYDWADGWRAEAELAHRFNDFGAIGNHEDSASSMHIWSLMLNVYRDFNEGGFISPYVGAGVGAAQVVFSGTGWDTGARPNIGAPGIPGGAILVPAAGARYVTTNDSDITYLANLIAGIGWRFSDQFIIDTQYRYVRLGETNYSGATPTSVGGSGVIRQGGTSFPGTTVGGETGVSDVSGHEGWITMRYLFAAPPPPPPPVVCEDVGFVVYFEWDRSNLTDQARAVINQAVNQARNCGVSSVAIDGHADRSGAAAYNVGLSERRARAVRDELVRLGVPASAISLQALGESRPAVQTPDGVREPLNRRAEVLVDLR